MKVAINIQADIQEIEVIINCMAEDENVQRIVSALDSLNTKLCCRRQGELFQIALNDILYIESVDRKTFIYTEQQIYETDKRLYELDRQSRQPMKKTTRKTTKKKATENVMDSVTSASVPATIEDGVVMYFNSFSEQQKDLINKAIVNRMPDIFIRQMFTMNYDDMKEFFDSYNK